MNSSDAAWAWIRTVWWSLLALALGCPLWLFERLALWAARKSHEAEIDWNDVKSR